MPTLVTGATGFIGSEITRQLLDRGDDVRILRREASMLDLLGEAAAHVEHAVGDVTDPDSLVAAMQGVEQVYHAAAYVGFGGRRARQRLFRINVQGTAHVVNAALKTGVGRLVHTSSMAAFGRPEHGDGRIDEATPWQPSRAITAYARSKYEAEMEIHRGLAEGLDAVMVNPSLVFGVGREGDNTRQIAERIRDGKIPAYPAGGTNVVDVRDVAAGHLRAMALGVTGERYFLGSENLSWKAIFETMADAFGVAPPRFRLPPRLAVTLAALSEAAAFATRSRPVMTRAMARQTARVHVYDHRKAVDELGCSFRPFSETARHLADAIG